MRSWRNVTEATNVPANQHGRVGSLRKAMEPIPRR